MKHKHNQVAMKTVQVSPKKKQSRAVIKYMPSHFFCIPSFKEACHMCLKRPVTNYETHNFAKVLSFHTKSICSCL